MKSFFNRLIVFLCEIIARLPFGLIFILSDVFYVFIFYVFRYRRKIAFDNLTRSFPEKSPAEIRQIAKKFYHHLSDLGLETLKFSRMTEKQLDERLIIHGLEIYEEYYKQGKSFIMLAMHYNNWEWSAGIQRYMKARYFLVYNPMRNNTHFENFMLQTRERFGSKTVQMNNAAKVAFGFRNSNKPGCLVLIADQTPPPTSQFWTTFLNQETGFFSGPMKIAYKTNQPVIFHHTKKVGRGRYEVFHYKLIENPADVKPEDILIAYINKLEEIIKDEPQYWLWSHRRWKHKRPENIKLHDR